MERGDSLLSSDHLPQETAWLVWGSLLRFAIGVKRFERQSARKERDPLKTARSRVLDKGSTIIRAEQARDTEQHPWRTAWSVKQQRAQHMQPTEETRPARAA